MPDRLDREGPIPRRMRPLERVHPYDSQATVVPGSRGSSVPFAAGPTQRPARVRAQLPEEEIATRAKHIGFSENATIIGLPSAPPYLTDSPQPP